MIFNIYLSASENLHYFKNLEQMFVETVSSGGRIDPNIDCIDAKSASVSDQCWPGEIDSLL